MNLKLDLSKIECNPGVKISGSKSETNRLLLLQALYRGLTLENISDSDDSRLMIEALNSEDPIIDIHHAGTAMRFLTSFFAVQVGQAIILTGSDRMKQRPISTLVDALRKLGADISYMENEGFPPLKIIGKELSGGEIEIDAGVSSQYISSLLLIGASLKNGIRLKLIGKITSAPYIQMTLALLNEIGIKTAFNVDSLIVYPATIPLDFQTVTIESDWSSASYYYSMIALSGIGTALTLSTFKPDSRQGDSALAKVYESFRVTTSFEQNSITITKVSNDPNPATLDPARLAIDLNNTPDLAQTIAVTCFGLGIACNLTGLQTLAIKETDRLTALKNELTKLGAKIEITPDSLMLEALPRINENIEIETYNDHRMAMAFAPLCVKVPIIIKEADVVSKSYPNFWTDLQSIGIRISQIPNSKI